MNDGACDGKPEIECAGTTACDWTSGAGLVRRNSLDVCLDTGRRWVDADEDDAAAVMFCLWSGGVQFGDPTAMRALLDALSPELFANDGCNAGFLRDDAWLLPIMIARGYPDIEGQSWQWAETIEGVKDGNDDAVVPVAILDPQTIPHNPPGCQEGIGDLTDITTSLRRFRGDR